MDLFRKKIVMGKTTVEVVLENRPFDYRRHRAAYDRGGALRIDGMPVYGADSAEPANLAQIKKHLARFEVRWNGRRVPIPPEIHRFVMDFTPKDSIHPSTDDGNLLITPAVRGDAILVHLEGGDAGTSFYLWWAIRREGVVGTFWEGEA